MLAVIGCQHGGVFTPLSSPSRDVIAVATVRIWFALVTRVLSSSLYSLLSLQGRDEMRNVVVNSSLKTQRLCLWF